jgi:hypothetical protein
MKAVWKEQVAPEWLSSLGLGVESCGWGRLQQTNGTSAPTGESQ